MGFGMGGRIGDTRGAGVGVGVAGVDLSAAPVPLGWMELRLSRFTIDLMLKGDVGFWKLYSK
jgi:hypothetical protein